MTDAWTVPPRYRDTMRCPVSGDLCTSWTCLVDVCVDPKEPVVTEPVQYPHCDSRVLHAPGECKYCDGHLDWQNGRIHDRICFTGLDGDAMNRRYRLGLPPVKWQACPADAARPPGAANDHRRWAGNKPTSVIGDPSWPAETFASHVMYGDHGGRAAWPLPERIRRRVLRPLTTVGYRLLGYERKDGLLIFSDSSRLPLGRVGAAAGRFLLRVGR